MGGNTIKKISLGSGLFISFLLIIYSVIERKKTTDHIDYLLFSCCVCIGLVSLILYLIYFIKSFSEKMTNGTKEE